MCEFVCTARMPTVAGKFQGVAGIVSVLAAILSSVCHRTITSRMATPFRLHWFQILCHRLKLLIRVQLAKERVMVCTTRYPKRHIDGLEARFRPRRSGMQADPTTVHTLRTGQGDSPMIE